MAFIFTIGRAPDNKIIFNDDSVGRYHAELHISSSGAIHIIDLNSTNGTKVNGIKITPNAKHLVNRGDKVIFATTALNWNKIPNYQMTAIENEVVQPPSAARFNDGILTDFAGKVSGTKDRFRSIKHFFSLMENTSDKIVALSTNPSETKFDAVEFFTIGMGFYLFNAYFLFGIVNDVGNENFLLPDFIMSIILALFIFLVALLNYNLFKLMTETQKRWSNYFNAWLAFSGYTFIGFSFITFPFVLIFFFDKSLWHDTNKIIFTLCLSVNAFYCLVWIPLIWIKMNKKFWETTYFRVIFILLAILGISLLVYKFVVSYLEH